MNPAAEGQRLFEPFLDTTDMVTCCPADTPLAQVNQQVAEYGLRFPLTCDPSASLQDHITTIEYTSHSARFGPYVDNILGMNWELKSGTVVRVGERVIKSTTGYDLMRFLLHSDGRYGRPVDCVLRLRPVGGETAHAALVGDDAAIERARSALLKSPWIHWLDVVDLSVSANDRMVLKLAADCAPGEGTVFEEFFRKTSQVSGTELTFQASARVARLPSLSLKTTVSAASALARRLVRDHGGTARVLCVNGAVHYFPPPELPSLPAVSLADLASRCTAEGGHLSGPWAKTPAPDAREAAWAAELAAVWNQL